MEEACVVDVQRVFGSILEELGETFSRELLLAEVGYRRVRPMKLMEAEFPPETTGGCLVLKDIILIFVRPGLEPIRLLFTELHECAHLLFGHAPVSRLTFADFLQKPDFQQVVYRERAITYDKPEEDMAELLATLLIERILQYEEWRNENAIPALVLELYG